MFKSDLHYYMPSSLEFSQFCITTPSNEAPCIECIRISSRFHRLWMTGICSLGQMERWATVVLLGRFKWGPTLRRGFLLSGHSILKNISLSSCRSWRAAKPASSPMIAPSSAVSVGTPSPISLTLFYEHQLTSSWAKPASTHICPRLMGA